MGWVEKLGGEPLFIVEVVVKVLQLETSEVTLQRNRLLLSVLGGLFTIKEAACAPVKTASSSMLVQNVPLVLICHW